MLLFLYSLHSIKAMTHFLFLKETLRNVVDPCIKPTTNTYVGVMLAKSKEYVLYTNESNKSRVRMIYGGCGSVLTKERKKVLVVLTTCVRKDLLRQDICIHDF